MATTPGGRQGDASSLAKPGYKGKRKLSDYEREVAHALMRKGHSKRRAIMMARGIIRNAAVAGKWGRGKVRNPAVRAGAAASIAQRKSFTDEERGLVISLAEAAKRGLTIDLVGPKGYVHGWHFVGVPAGGIKVRAARGRHGKSRRGVVRDPSVTRTKGAKSKASGAALEKRYQTMRQNNHHAVSLIKPALDAAAAHRREGNSLKAKEMEQRARQHAADHLNIFSKRKDSAGEDARKIASQQTDPRVRALLGHSTEPSKSSATYSISKRGENHHVVKKENGKSTTVYKSKNRDEAVAHAARLNGSPSERSNPTNAPQPTGKTLPGRPVPDISGMSNGELQQLIAKNDPRSSLAAGELQKRANAAREKYQADIKAKADKAAAPKLTKVEGLGPISRPGQSGGYRVKEGSVKEVRVNGEVVGYVARGNIGGPKMSGRVQVGWQSESSGYLAFDANGRKIRGRYLTEANQADAVELAHVRHGALVQKNPEHAKRLQEIGGFEDRAAAEEISAPKPVDQTPKGSGGVVGASVPANVQAAVNRMSTEEIKRMLADPRYKSWTGILTAELNSRKAR